MTQQIIGQKRQMLPTFGLRIVAPTGRQHMHMGMILTVASMGMNYGDVAPLEDLTSHFTIEVIKALHAASHHLTQQDVSVLVERRAEHGRHGQDEMSIDQTLVKRLADLTDPVVDVDFGTSQAQRRFTTHRHQMLALSTCSQRYSI